MGRRASCRSAWRRKRQRQRAGKDRRRGARGSLWRKAYPGKNLQMSPCIEPPRLRMARFSIRGLAPGRCRWFLPSAASTPNGRPGKTCWISSRYCVSQATPVRDLPKKAARKLEVHACRRRDIALSSEERIPFPKAALFPLLAPATCRAISRTAERPARLRLVWNRRGIRPQDNRFAA